MNSPQKKKPKEEAEPKRIISEAAKPNICGYSGGGRHKPCGCKTATSIPPTAEAAGAVLDPSRCNAHQPCSLSTCGNVVSIAKFTQEAGLCHDCYKLKRDNDTAEANQRWAKSQEVPASLNSMFSKMATTFSTGGETPPTLLQDKLKEKGLIDTDDVKEFTLSQVAGMKTVEIKSSSDESSLSLKGLDVFIISGNIEPVLGTPRKVIEDHVNGNRVTVEGIEKTMWSSSFAIYRNEKGRAFEEKYLDSQSARNLMFVNSKDDIDFQEKTKRTMLQNLKSLPLAFLGSDGRVKIHSTTLQGTVDLGNWPESESDAAKERAMKWFRLEYKAWAKQKASEKAGEPITLNDIHNELSRIGVSSICVVIYVYTSFHIR